MADTLLIHYSPASPDRSVWSIANTENELSTKLTRGSLTEAASFAEGKRVVMLIDSNFVHLDQVSLPTKNKQKLLNAVPYALEEQLADEVEDLHFVIANNPDNNKTAVACIAKDTLDKILSRCEDAGLKLDAIIPDALCLAADKKQWAILLYEETAHIQQHGLLSNCIERDYYRPFLESLLKTDDTEAPDKIIIFQPQGEAAEEIDSEHLSDTEIIPVTFNDHPIVIFCSHYKQAMPLNLLQNQYKPSRKANAYFQRWRPAASLAALWLLIHLGSIAYQNKQLSDANQALRTQVIQIYKASFPESKKIVNARFQMEQKLKELGSSSDNDGRDIISLLAESHRAFSSHKDTSIKSLTYRNERIEITITSNNLKTVELINKTLNTNTLKSEIISSTSSNNIVTGNLRIQRPTS